MPLKNKSIAALYLDANSILFELKRRLDGANDKLDELEKCRIILKDQHKQLATLQAIIKSKNLAIRAKED